MTTDGTTSTDATTRHVAEAAPGGRTHDTSAPAVEAAPRRSTPPPATRRAATVAGVLGELMITLGVLLLAFVAWQLWWTDVEGERAQAAIVEELDWAPIPAPDEPAPPPPAPAVMRRDASPPMAEPAYAETFATMLVPRWGPDYERPVSQGVDRATVLDPLGIGHYPGTAMPGDVGNFAVSGHRTTYGKPFNRVAELQIGDPIVVRTADIWYVYRVTSTQIVLPEDVQVIAPAPNEPGVEPTVRSITLTTCHPMYSARERFIVHGELDYWMSTADGFPAEISGGA
ncbi:class E sortase [Cellulomonas fimi]|uniref:Class E sortase n=1 Tax=Cellulomonas fimi TaxID=1708 RepID=A0A7Y0QHM4_CELFI|nr:class E sortase [Cellulomonas fimi]NMR20445.1 class E sortase [Cellulomonas fimi]